MKCPLEGRPFYCRDWVFNKIRQYADARKVNQLNAGGILITGQAGAGKSAVCCQLTHPVSPDQLQLSLHKRVVAAHFCQRFDAASQEVATFVRSIADQLAHHDSVPKSYRDRYESGDASIHSWLDTRRCLAQPLEAVYHAIVEPLIESHDEVHETLLIVVDSLHECSLETPNSSSASDSIVNAPLAELVSQMAGILPNWLMVIASARRGFKVIQSLFTSFRKINLDDLRRSYAVTDIQQYILQRLDAEDQLRSQLDVETAEMLNQLHIKSAGCILYLQLVLDGVRDGFIRLREVNNIPGTLNGLYLWLCQRLFTNNNSYVMVKLLLQILLACRRPLAVRHLYRVARARTPTINKAVFAETLRCMGPLLIEYDMDGETDPLMETSAEYIRCLGSGSTVLIFHPSFEQWLVDVKYCTRKYLCDPAEGHGALALSYASVGADLSPEQIVCFAYHLSRCPCIQPFTVFAAGHRASFLIQSGAAVQDLILDCPVIDEATTKLLMEAGADFVTVHSRELNEADRKVDEEIRQFVRKQKQVKKQNSTSHNNRSDHQDYVDLDAGSVAGNSNDQRSVMSDDVMLMEEYPLDNDDRCALHEAAAQGKVRTVDKLLLSGVYADAEDHKCDTAICLAARAGHASIVEKLAIHGAQLDHVGHEQWTPLRAAAFAAHTETVDVLLKYGASVDFCGADQRRALRAASWAGHLDIVSLLLINGARVDAEDDQKRTALMTAAYMAHDRIVATLLKRGANVNLVDSDGRNALMLTVIAAPIQAEHGAQHRQIINTLVKYGIQINARDRSGRTALFTAAIEGLSSIAELLIKLGADADLCDELGNSPLSAAAACGHAQLVRLLIQLNASADSMDNEGRTSLSVAAAQGHESVIHVLLELGLDEMHADNGGWLPLHHAVFNGHVGCVDVLMTASPATIGQVDKEGRTPLYLAAQEGHVKVVEMLLDAVDAGIDKPTHLGWTPMRVAVLHGHVAVAECLIKHDADLNVNDVDGLSILMAAVSNGQTEACDLLLRSGARRDACDSHERSALHVAAALGNHAIVDALIAHKADIDSTDKDGRTPLHSAMWAKQLSTARLLLCRGANPNAVCAQKASALSIAAQLGDAEGVRLLLSYNADIKHKDSYGRTAIEVATIAGNQHICQLLVNCINQVSMSVPGSTGTTSTTSTSGVCSLNGDGHSPPTTWTLGQATHSSDQSSSISSTCVSPDNGEFFVKQLASRSNTRPFSGVFNHVVVPDTTTSSSVHPQPDMTTSRSYTQVFPPPKGSDRSLLVSSSLDHSVPTTSGLTTSQSVCRRQRPRIATNPKHRPSSACNNNRNGQSSCTMSSAMVTSPQHVPRMDLSALQHHTVHTVHNTVQTQAYSPCSDRTSNHQSRPVHSTSGAAHSPRSVSSLPHTSFTQNTSSSENIGCWSEPDKCNGDVRTAITLSPSPSLIQRQHVNSPSQMSHHQPSPVYSNRSGVIRASPFIDGNKMNDIDYNANNNDAMMEDNNGKSTYDYAADIQDELDRATAQLEHFLMSTSTETTVV